MRLTIDESCDSFRELRENGAYYVDKTLMLKHYLADDFKSVVLFARPHRFGKTLTMTMFRDFLDVRQSSRDIFAGLEIMEHPDVVDRFMNRYPVVFISLKEVSGSTFDTVLRRLSAQVSDLFGRHRDLLESDAISKERKELLLRFCAEAADQVHLEKSLDLLSQILAAHYHRPAFAIVDEYDAPMAKALGTPFYEQVSDMVEHMLSYVCKTNDSVRAVLLSGCLYTVRNSAYTGVNNIIPYTVLSANYATSIGFTDEDVRRLLDDAGIPEHAGVVEEWYDGYVFGRDKMFCPWDALHYVASVLDGSYDADQGPQSHWVNTSSTSMNLIGGFLGKAPNAVEGLERLMAGETIDCCHGQPALSHDTGGRGEPVVRPPGDGLSHQGSEGTSDTHAASHSQQERAARLPAGGVVLLQGSP